MVCSKRRAQFVGVARERRAQQRGDAVTRLRPAPRHRERGPRAGEQSLHERTVLRFAGLVEAQIGGFVPPPGLG